MHSTKVKETAEAKSVEQEMMDEAVNILKRYLVYATGYGAETIARPPHGVMQRQSPLR